MKRFVLIAVLLTAFFPAFAQYEPTTTWPYYYQEFTAGQIVMTGGSENPGFFNIHLAKCRLHFIEGENIREVMSSEVQSLTIGKDEFVNVDGRIVKVLSRSDKGLVVENVEIDIARLNSTEGAYGSSASTISTSAYSSLEGIGGTQSNMNHMELRNRRDDGKILPLNYSYVLVIGEKTVPASAKEVSALDGVDKAALKTFLKENRIKWKDVSSLQKLVDYLAD